MGRLHPGAGRAIAAYLGDLDVHQLNDDEVDDLLACVRDCHFEGLDEGASGGRGGSCKRLTTHLLPSESTIRTPGGSARPADRTASLCQPCAVSSAPGPAAARSAPAALAGSASPSLRASSASCPFFSAACLQSATTIAAPFAEDRRGGSRLGHSGAESFLVCLQVGAVDSDRIRSRLR